MHHPLVSGTSLNGHSHGGSFEETLTSHSKGHLTMTASHIRDPASVLSEALGDASPGLMRHLLQTMINALLSADADAVVGAE